MRVVAVVFLLFPLLELAVLIKVGSAIGVLATLGLLVFSAVLGSFLLRIAGVSTAWRARERLMRGERPEPAMLEGLMMALGGGLLILPGLISDVLGLLCIIPFTRNLMLRAVLGRLEARVMGGRTFEGEPGPQPDVRPRVIEGEYQRHD